MAHALVGIGSNLGNPAKQLDQALARLAALPGLELLRSSAPLWSPAVGGPTDQPDFLNAAALVASDLDPPTLVDALLDLERSMGRQRIQPWGPRIVDLDLLCLDNCVVATDHLVIPHPWMCVRSFVVKPCREIAPDYRHPLVELTMDQLWQRLSDPNGAVAVVSAHRDHDEWVGIAVAGVCADTGWTICHADSSDLLHLIELTSTPSVRPTPSQTPLRALVVLDGRPPSIGLDRVWQLLPEPDQWQRAPAVSLAISDAADAELKLRVALAAITAV